jgi:bacterioferritin (cytochrome b1)
MSADPRLIELFSYYRDAELHGANLLMRLMKLMDDPDSQVKLSLHVAEETNHAWLWTKRITDLGGEPMRVLDGYQTRIGKRTVPRSLIDLLALTIVVEERAYARYQEHAARPNVDEETMNVLKAATKDEKWHISWIKGKLDELAAQEEGGVERAQEMMARYREIDEAIYAQLAAKEREIFGDELGVAAAH